LPGAGFFWTTFFCAGLTAWGLPGIGFLATGLVGMEQRHLPYSGCAFKKESQASPRGMVLKLCPSPASSRRRTGNSWQHTHRERPWPNRKVASFLWVSAGKNKETRAALDKRVRDSGRYFCVIPILLPGAKRNERSRLPTFLAATTWVEFRDSLEDPDAFYRLVCG
jgi:hypothetical protein